MKKLSILSVLFILLLGMAACEKEGESPIVELKSPPAITVPANGTSYVLEEVNAADTLVKITWNSANFNFMAAISNKVEIAVAGTSFAAPKTLGTVSTTQLPITISAMNNALINMGLPPFEESQIELRVTATVNPLVEAAVSNIVTLNVTPYLTIPTFPMVNVPGSYQGWDPAKPETAIPSVNSNDLYEGYIYFADPNTEFKFALGSWATNWGDDGADGTLEPGGANITAADAGLYKLNVDLVGLTYTKLKTDWGLIGSATPDGWNSDQNMTYDPATNSWTITLDLVVGEIKFRANDDWGLNYGDTGADGDLDVGGDNIAISEAGNYTITLDLRQTFGFYDYKIVKN